MDSAGTYFAQSFSIRFSQGVLQKKRSPVPGGRFLLNWHFGQKSLMLE
ncbi:MAG: hypothetical protein BSOLF_0678 [Candidatus Carbobacillus altaicus]|uniref:Uncharacterized protein n=1 Tax=Candidatus Carbonibacillus altaicus TaxID=2163959 RepID=A0A2R6Y560_9BACL|nr:MAG: hypothetical protein BSOLF_0678 [Candidatus Carbobacillus altaicus]